MINQGLRQLQDALNRKAAEAQNEFTALGEQLKLLSRQLGDRHADPADQAAASAQQTAVRERQQVLADEVNLWRDHARKVLQQRDDDALKNYLQGLREASDGPLLAVVDHALALLNASDAELEQMAQREQQAKPTTPAGRLLERARTDFDLRGTDPAARHRAASEFANRPNMAQDDAALAELEVAFDAPDSTVRELATLTAIQMHRFRAVRLADLDVSQESVERLVKLDHPAVVPVLIEVLNNARTGYTQTGETRNNQSLRMLALERLAAWRTPDARRALEARQQDRDSRISDAARRALEG